MDSANQHNTHFRLGPESPEEMNLCNTPSSLELGSYPPTFAPDYMPLVHFFDNLICQNQQLQIKYQELQEGCQQLESIVLQLQSQIPSKLDFYLPRLNKRQRHQAQQRRRHKLAYRAGIGALRNGRFHE
ncbi:hypothetical protein ACJZ2D_009573 [Fusarium nematophilum]